MRIEMSEQEWFNLVKLVYHEKTPLELIQQLDPTVKRIEQERLKWPGVPAQETLMDAEGWITTNEGLPENKSKVWFVHIISGKDGVMYSGEYVNSCWWPDYHECCECFKTAEISYWQHMAKEPNMPR